MHRGSLSMHRMCLSPAKPCKYIIIVFLILSNYILLIVVYIIIDSIRQIELGNPEAHIIKRIQSATDKTTLSKKERNTCNIIHK